MIRILYYAKMLSSVQSPNSEELKGSSEREMDEKKITCNHLIHTFLLHPKTIYFPETIYKIPGK